MSNLGCMVCIDESTIGIVERCGKYDSTMSSGCSCVFSCLGYMVVGYVSTRVQQLDIECETKTKDNVFVTLQVSVQYKAFSGKEREAFYSLENYEMQIRAYVYDVIRSAVPKINLDKVFEQKEEIAQTVKSEVSKSMEDYGWEIMQVLISDIEPDPKVKAAMNDINAAQRQRVATVDKAESEKLMVVKRAEAEAESKYLGGVGIARQRKAICEGLRDSVLTFTDNIPDASPKEVMELVLVTQYFDTLKELGEKAHPATIFLPGTNEGPSSDLRNSILEAQLAMYAQATSAKKK